MRPRGLPSAWVRITPWYYTESKEPSRRAELEQALAFETAAGNTDYDTDNEHHYLCWRGDKCPAEYRDTCGDEHCVCDFAVHCPCTCHEGKCGCD